MPDDQPSRVTKPPTPEEDLRAIALAPDAVP